MTPMMMIGLTFVVGFVGGYIVRAQVSFRRRRRVASRGYYSRA